MRGTVTEIPEFLDSIVGPSRQLMRHVNMLLATLGPVFSPPLVRCSILQMTQYHAGTLQPPALRGLTPAQDRHILYT